MTKLPSQPFPSFRRIVLYHGRNWLAHGLHPNGDCCKIFYLQYFCVDRFIKAAKEKQPAQALIGSQIRSLLL